MGFNSFNYVDDFLGIQYLSMVKHAHMAMVNLLRDLGMGRSESKSVDQVLEFVGNLVYANNMTLGVMPQRKITVLAELEMWRTKTTCTRKQLC